jgi:hypothetical protein
MHRVNSAIAPSKKSSRNVTNYVWSGILVRREPVLG